MKTEKGEPVAVGAQTMLEVASATELSSLFAEHHRRVLRAAYRITGSMADAEDVVQAVFLCLAHAGEPVSNPASYLYRAAINGALDLLRRRKAAASEPLDAALAVASVYGSPETTVSDNELRNWLRLALAQLSPRAAEMFTLRYVEGHSNREIAALMGTSQAVVAVTLHGARSKLRNLLQQYERGQQ